MTHNPWKVDSLQAFSCLKCPECPFFTKEENTFANHAIANHPLSKILFDYNVKKVLKPMLEESKKNAVVNFEIVSNDFFNQLEVLDPSTEEKTPFQASQPLKRKRKDYSTGGNNKIGHYWVMASVRVRLCPLSMSVRRT